METKPIEDLLSENEEPLNTVDKAIEGLEHMDEQQDLLEVTFLAVHDLQSRYENRRALHGLLEDLATRTRDAIEALLADGYPEEPMPEVDHEVTEDLDQNFDTLECARSQVQGAAVDDSRDFRGWRAACAE